MMVNDFFMVFDLQNNFLVLPHGSADGATAFSASFISESGFSLMLVPVFATPL